MSRAKRRVRAEFRDVCFRRDGYACVLCGFRSDPARAGDELDAHHITDRNDMPAGGYVAENGISLCARCHERAEMLHSTGTPYPGYSREELYAAIGSSYEAAWMAARASGGDRRS